MTNQNMSSQMGLGAEIIEQVWERLMPYELPKLRQMPAERVLVVTGSYDHVEEILKNAKIPHVKTNLFPEAKHLVQGGKYKDTKVIFVDCDSSYHDRVPGFEEKGLGRDNKRSLIDFVNQGGRIVTTDWAQEVVKYLFGKITSKQGVLPEEVVRVGFPSEIGRNLLGINYSDARPNWWIEGSSDMITPKRNSGVVSLITSEELRKKHRSKYVSIGFKQGQGEVFHFVSHLVAQRFRDDNARDNQSLQDFLDQTGTTLKGKNRTKYVSFGGIETTYTLMNTVLELIREKPILP